MSRNDSRAVTILAPIALCILVVSPLHAGIGLFGSGADENAPPKPSAEAFDHADAYLPETLNNQAYNSTYRAAPAVGATSATDGYSAPARQPQMPAAANPAVAPAAFNRPANNRFPVQNADYNSRGAGSQPRASTAAYNQPVGGGANMLPAEFASRGAKKKTYTAPGSPVQPASHSQPVAGTLNQGDEYGVSTRGLNQNNGTLADDSGRSSNSRPSDDGSSLRTAALPEGFVSEGDAAEETFDGGRNLRPTDATPADFAEVFNNDTTSYLSNANRLPEIFGDFYSTFGAVRSNIGGSVFDSDLPLAGGSRRVKIAEHNKPMPDSRYYFLYNSFNNALDARGPGGARSHDVDRYTIGFEHSQLFGGNHSIEVRAPFTSGYDFNQGAFGVSGGEIGNVAVIWKSILLSGDNWSITGGAGVDTPTGEDVTGIGGGTPFKLDNSAVHVLPYVGFEVRPSNRFFYQGFIQGDFAANSNTFSAGGNSGSFSEQHLLHLDFATGMWLMRDWDASFLTGLALMGEFHYSTTLQDSDVVALNSGGNSFVLRNPANQFDTLNAVLGVHAEFSRHIALRAGWAFPLADEEFSSEITASVIWYH